MEPKEYSGVESMALMDFLLFVVIGALVGIVWSLKYLVSLERRVIEMDEKIEDILYVLKEEVDEEKREIEEEKKELDAIAQKEGVLPPAREEQKEQPPEGQQEAQAPEQPPVEGQPPQAPALPETTGQGEQAREGEDRDAPY